MTKYHKIQSVFKRDPENNHKTFLMTEWSTKEFESLQGNMWEFTEKVDGTNIRVIWDGLSLSFEGRNDNSQIPTPLIDTLYDLIMISTVLDILPMMVVMKNMNVCYLVK